MRRHLEAQGYAVDEATDGILALEMHRKKPYRIVVSDWMMPSMDGVSLCREFRSLGGSYVYFVLCSARTDRSDRTEAFEAGVDDFLTKPIDRGELASRLIVARRILSSEDVLRRQRKQLEETARRLAEGNVELRALSRKYAGLFDGLPVACFTFDSEGLVREWNREAEVAFGIRADVAAGAPVWNVLGGADEDAWSEERARLLMLGSGGDALDWSLRSSDGQEKNFAANIICVRDDAGRPIGVVCANVDITARKRAEAQIADFARQVNAQKVELEAMNHQLNHLVITDELTGLANRRHFREMLISIIAGHKEVPISLLLLDLDHFKRVNDARGHLAGDQVLRQFAQVLRRNANEGELLVRYGGEEFAVLIVGADQESAELAGERYRRSVEKEDLAGLGVTTSVGVATAFASETSIDDLVGRADAALYTAKESGRNRVCTADPAFAARFY
ncbi:response regulator receiver modulated diguanylate cyclase [Fimbriimonas ginsengisoli Gsoil 348]|uniref:Response regulator receiver modulated diguanylate cyclase n=1 Tax=Fimbriimonas ginsengisoli Gsoil 348 TaxID=661478 RepID=A0A068NYF0_FIMGI|nr:response regulator receiver modulated diguanylate cyclase [Fimbriimonas ginsengisoli Gsoil 348]